MEGELLGEISLLAENKRLREEILQLKKEKEDLHRILDNEKGPLLLIGEDFKVISANKAFYETFKVVEEEFRGISLAESGSGRWNIPELPGLLDALKKGKEPVNNFEVTHHFKSIGTRTLCLDAKLLPENSEGKNLIFLKVEDITENAQTQTELRESIHRYNEFIHSSPSFIAILTGRDLIVEVVNDAMLDNWGKGRDVVGKPLIKEVLPEMAEQGMEEIFHQVYDTGEPYHAHEMPLIHHRDGEPHLGYFDFVYQPQRDLQGQIVGVAVIANEVTAQAELHKQLREDERKFRQMADLIPDKISNGDPNSYIFYYNKSWLDFSGYSQEELKILGWQKLVHPQDIKKLEELYVVAIRKGTGFEAEIRFLNKKRKYKWHLVRAVQVKDEEGNLKSWLCASTEIHKFKQEEKRKEDFLKLVSHELKTPVTSIKGYVQLLIRMMDSTEGISIDSLPLRSSLNRIDSQVSRLTRLISEMLDLSRVEEGRLDLQNEIFDINDIVLECVQDVKYSNPNAKIEVHQQAQFRILGDKDRLGQVIINLVTNAIKYSPENKKIEVHVLRNSQGEGLVCVKDQGIGIDKKDHHNIFKRFFRVSGNNEETYSGFGIGLYLAREIIQRHNGSINVKSEPGVGSEFIIKLPVIE